MDYQDHVYDYADRGGDIPDPLLCAGSLAPKSGTEERSDSTAATLPPETSQNTQDALGYLGSSLRGGADGHESYDDGSSYRGQLLSERRHGRGVWTSHNECYSGQWKNDHRDGHGRQTWQDDRDKRMYEGQFKGGKFDGHGRMEWHTPSGVMVYEGQYVDDKKHGLGRYSWPDGRVYDGQWVEGKRSGKAKFTNTAGLTREGVWSNDKVESWGPEDPYPDARSEGQT